MQPILLLAHQLWPALALKRTPRNTLELYLNMFVTHDALVNDRFLWLFCAFPVRLVCPPWAWRRTVAGRRLWYVRSSTSFIPCWRRRRGRWARKWQTNRKRSWTTSVPWPGSTETTWSRAVRSLRWGSRTWRSQKWLYSYRSDSIYDLKLCSDGKFPCSLTPDRCDRAGKLQLQTRGRLVTA